jgi:CRISPR-associated protein Cmr1
MTWTTLTLQVTTPLFNGGADAGATARAGDGEGVRVASIRGAMRFWFRALAGMLTGPELGLLGSLERRVFGGIGEGSGGASSSPLLLRIPAQPALVQPTGPHDFLPRRPPETDWRAMRDYKQDRSRWILYLMGQGLADLAKFEIKRSYVPPGEEFDLMVGFRHPRGVPAPERAAIEGLALASLWLTCTYGGIGARVRRGFGGVRITGAKAGPGASGDLPLPAPWTQPSTLLTPGLDHYEALKAIWPAEPVASCIRYISALAGDARLSPRAWGEDIPSFPVMSRTHAPAGVSGGEAFSDWKRTLIHAGEQWRYFRAAEVNSSQPRRYEPFIETPEWIETINRDKARFPLGALGLPVVFKDKYEVKADGAGHGDPPRRRASPLSMRVVGGPDDYRLLSYAFQSEFLPSAVRLWRGQTEIKPVQVTDDDVRRQTGQWIKVLRDDDSFVHDGQDDDRVHRRLTGGMDGSRRP